MYVCIIIFDYTVFFATQWIHMMVVVAVVSRHAVGLTTATHTQNYTRGTYTIVDDPTSTPLTTNYLNCEGDEADEEQARNVLKVSQRLISFSPLRAHLYGFKHTHTK
jgi:hypothetical protein